VTDTTNIALPMALLLGQETHLPEDRHLQAILDFFGIPWASLTIAQVRNGEVASLTAGHARYSILVSAPCLAEALHREESGILPNWLSAAASVYIYGFHAADACRTLLRELTGDPEADICSLDARPTTLSIAVDFPEMCGPMSGLQVHIEPGPEAVLSIPPDKDTPHSIVGTPEGDLFAGIPHAGVPFFCDASQTIIDIHQCSKECFDVRRSFVGAVPLVMYLKWAFRDICWTTQETNACLIIDDPPLKPRYGFLDFRELLQLMDTCKFTTTVAFIPWNWKRTNRSTVSTFLQHSEVLSVCVHGCDHTAREFAARSSDLLEKKLKVAKHRMRSLLEKTGLNHDQVMVFPQGVFSPETAPALKRNGFVAAVNTEVASAGPEFNEVEIADLWSVAILRYGMFPIFTRRYISHGIENFAFDGLLGKPCFIVGHHELFRDHGSKLSIFVRALNSLNWKLCWRTLEDAISHTYSVQHRDGEVKVKMCAERLIVENLEEKATRVAVFKEEEDPSAVASIQVNQQSIKFGYKNGGLQFVVDIPAKCHAVIHCNYHDSGKSVTASDLLSYRIKVAARRYLCEIRDDLTYRSAILGRATMVSRFLRK
jgi:hypothetical protein